MEETAVDLQKAVEIARDVLAQLKINKYTPACGIYFIDEKSYKSIFTRTTYTNILNVIDKPCHVCALGASIMSAARLYNHDLYECTNVFSSISKYLTRFFFKKNLELMEFVYEKGLAGLIYGEIRFREITKEEIKAKKYGEKYEDDSERLRVIMLNVIRNKGQFIIPKRIK